MYVDRAWGETTIVKVKQQKNITQMQVCSPITLITQPLQPYNIIILSPPFSTNIQNMISSDQHLTPTKQFILP